MSYLPIHTRGGQIRYRVPNLVHLRNKRPRTSAIGPYPANYYTGSVTETEQKKSKMGSTYVSRSYKKTGRVRRRNTKALFKSVIGGGDEVIYRWQQTSKTYVGPGKLMLGWRNYSADYQAVPIHMLSLTAHDKGSVVNAKGCFNSGLARILYRPANGSFAWQNDTVSQNYLGDNASVTNWQVEKDDTGTGGAANFTRRLFHKYTDIKLNLYGAYSVPVHYKVMLCTMKEQRDPYQFLPVGAGGAIAEGTETANMFKDWCRVLLHDSVSVNNKQDWRGDVRIIKQYSCTINPLTYDDQAAERGLPEGYSAAPKIQELRWFVRHDRFRDYKWSRNEFTTFEDKNFESGGWDYTNQSATMCDVEWGKRVFLVIMASSPEVYGTIADPSPYMDTAAAVLQGSYDLCVRNSFVYYS